MASEPAEESGGEEDEADEQEEKEAANLALTGRTTATIICCFLDCVSVGEMDAELRALGSENAWVFVEAPEMINRWDPVDCSGRLLGHLILEQVGEMDAELRALGSENAWGVELNSRLRLLTADLKGEIMSDVAARIAAAEVAVGGIEAKLSSDLDNVCEADLVPRMKALEDHANRTNLVLSTIQEALEKLYYQLDVREKGPWCCHDLEARGADFILPGDAMWLGSDKDLRPDADGENKAKLLIPTGLRQRLHGLVSALSWTLGQEMVLHLTLVIFLRLA
ncbi:hypothetical protein AK812_SmicGene8274 [Symbiodinium microadriaticum]|uniref:Uncharacterized protein n=1 Tax=Symbiodinium microadriaticum TaxID=2951 RepID=A0A1Q9ELH1_SYMMI|nr:hypothetical protein AK812_SmicGene8274 [Symbiodinium microadriaticum]